jgi:hypothetical protein
MVAIYSQLISGGPFGRSQAARRYIKKNFSQTSQIWIRPRCFRRFRHVALVAWPKSQSGRRTSLCSSFGKRRSHPPWFVSFSITENSVAAGPSERDCLRRALALTSLAPHTSQSGLPVGYGTALNDFGANVSAAKPANSDPSGVMRRT